MESFIFKGFLKGHNGWVTSISTITVTDEEKKKKDVLVSSSRDKTLISWELTKDQLEYGFPKKLLEGHTHIVSDCSISVDGQYALSSSWDHNLKLWELKTGKCTKNFKSHTSDVLSVSFSPDNRQIVSAGRDKAVKLWNTLGECKYTIGDGASHSHWISCVKISPNPKFPIFVTGGWDKTVKVWNLQTCKEEKTLKGHKGVVNSVAISPDGSLCASGGKDGVAMLWDLSKGEHLYSLNAEHSINCLTFSPNRYWLVIATDQSIKVYNLKTKKTIAELIPEKMENPKAKPTTKLKAPSCVSLCWSQDGSTLYSGYTDNKIRVWGVIVKSNAEY